MKILNFHHTVIPARESSMFMDYEPSPTQG